MVAFLFGLFIAFCLHKAYNSKSSYKNNVVDLAKERNKRKK